MIENNVACAKYIARVKIGSIQVCTQNVYSRSNNQIFNTNLKRTYEPLKITKIDSRKKDKIKKASTLCDTGIKSTDATILLERSFWLQSHLPTATSKGD